MFLVKILGSKWKEFMFTQKRMVHASGRERNKFICTHKNTKYYGLNLLNEHILGSYKLSPTLSCWKQIKACQTKSIIFFEKKARTLSFIKSEEATLQPKIQKLNPEQTPERSNRRLV
jgi:hypothetical protein